jgi:hypothetical protein
MKALIIHPRGANYAGETAAKCDAVSGALHDLFRAGHEPIPHVIRCPACPANVPVLKCRCLSEVRADTIAAESVAKFSAIVESHAAGPTPP